jgi:3D (Asp-Asp-Asp) domain-containing protein
MKLLVFIFGPFISSIVLGSTILLDQIPVPDLRPTMYYIANESETACEGRYNGGDFDGTEVSEVLSPSGELIANVCTRFFKVLSMEGTGVLRDRGQGELTVNWAGSYRFKVMDKCIYGEGVKGLCLIPYHTIAADLTVYPVGTIIYIPRAEGLKLPNNKIHNGYFIVRDTGGAFRGIGPKRVDLFVGVEHDRDNIFSRIGMDHHTDEKAFKIEGKRREMVQSYFKIEYPELF